MSHSGHVQSRSEANATPDQRRAASSFGNSSFNGAIGLTFWILFIITCLCTMLILTHSNILSDQRQCKYHTSHPWFLGNLARNHLKRFTSIGVRLAGTINNELHAAAYLRNELKSLVELSKTSNLSVSLDEQTSTYSSYALNRHVSTYNNLRNFILKISGDSSGVYGKRPVFLVNCHYDSALTSPGASDAFTGCAILLEISRFIIGTSPWIINDFIFLFNGAEEMMLPSSHAFITQHAWSDNISAFLNIEGAGSGGRLMIFQSGPGRASEILVDIYANSFTAPYGGVLAEDLFQSGIIPSDTDFRIFRDHGHIPGLDLAYVSNGYAYHTPYDVESRLSQPCLVQSGTDIARFLSNIAADSRLREIERLNASEEMAYNALSNRENRLVYFDVLGKTFLTIKWTHCKFFHYALTIVLVIRFIRSNFLKMLGFRELFTAICLQTIAQVGGLIVAFTIGVCFHKFGVRMSWFSAWYNLIGLFTVPVFLWYLIFYNTLFNSSDVMPRFIRTYFRSLDWLTREGICNSHVVEKALFNGAISLFVMFLVVLSHFNIPSSFIIAIWLFFAVLGRNLTENISLNHGFATRHFLFSIVPVFSFLHAPLCATLFEVFIPILGRAGNSGTPDVIIGASVVILMSPVVMLVAGLLATTSTTAAAKLRHVLLNIFLTYVVLIHTSTYGFPYRIPSEGSLLDPLFVPSVQRIVVIHQDRHLQFSNSEKNTDSYLLLLPLDVNGVTYLRQSNRTKPSLFSILGYPELDPNFNEIGISSSTLIEEISCNYTLPYCGLGAFYPLWHRFSYFYKINTPAHNNTAVNYHWTKQQYMFQSKIISNLTFYVDRGPPHLLFTFRFDESFVSLSETSFPLSETSLPVTVDNSAMHYTVSHVNAAMYGDDDKLWSDPWVLWLAFEQKDSGSDAYIDIAFTSSFMDNMLPSGSSPYLETFVDNLPPWTTVASLCATYNHTRIRV